jgi:hypothetical protein
VKKLIDELAKDFTSRSHGSSDYWSDTVYVRGENDEVFIPISYLQKKDESIKDVPYLQSRGYVLSSLTYLDLRSFDEWYQNRFNRKLTLKDRKAIDIVHYPDSKKIFEAVEIVDQVYQILKDHKVLVNCKNLPIQLGEWYAKTILGLHQRKSSSQRGFDFYTFDNKKVEVKIHWQDATSPKGVTLKRSLVEMSDYTVVMYVAKNFMVRDILLLDSDFVIRKFAGKGHTIFLKDGDIQSYFFSRSNKHYNKIANKTALMQFSTPDLAIKIDDRSNL